MTAAPRWVSKPALLLLHAQGLVLFGGAAGVRDDGLLESALARPLNLHAYDGMTEICRLAAAYAFGIARNHAFMDGNKRAALAAGGVFLKLNGLNLVAPQPVATAAMLDLAAGDLPEEGFSAWLRDSTRPRGG